MAPTMLFLPIGVSRPAKILSLAITAPRVLPTTAGACSLLLLSTV